MASELQIYNLAVDAVGGTGTIETLSEESREAELCRRWFGPVRDQVLRGAHWTNAKAYRRLALVAERDDDIWGTTSPTPGYLYGFSVPDQMLYPRYMTDFSRFEFSLQGDSDNHMISTSSSDPVLCYTRRIPPNLFDSALQAAVVAALGASICSPLTGSKQKARMLLQEANAAIQTAQVQTANQDMQTIEHIPDFIAIRGYGGSRQMSNFVYPFGTLFSAGDIGG